MSYRNCSNSDRTDPPYSQQHNPFGQYQQNTYNIARNAQYNPLGPAFAEGQIMLNKLDFRNQGNVLHDNLKDDLLHENIIEYTINIDSFDRNISSYPDPFHFVCTFGAIAGGMIQREEYIDYSHKEKGTQIISEKMPGTSMPYIRRKFSNVKYIKLECASLPLYSNIVYDAGTLSWIFDTSSTLTKDRFVVLKIKELDSHKVHSTGPVTDGYGFILVPDTIPTGSNYFTAVPPNITSKIFIFKDSHLGNLERLTIDFTDSFGTPLKYSNLDSNVPISDIRNPKYKYSQPHITFTVGVVENELHTDTKFDQ